MRTTLTLDEDVRIDLEKTARERNQKLRVVVNEALRAGLLALRSESNRAVEPYRTQPVSLGRPRLPDLDNVAEVLAVAEGDDRP